ncbi:MAG: sigma 54-interacting transcriptional regulator, partial [bacterium]
SISQTKLLRVIETGEFHRVGGTTSVRVDVRLLAATNKDLSKEIEEGSFREDLYYRINVVSLEMPPLKERPEDIPVLAKAFLERFAEKFEKPVKGIREEVMERFMAYEWPGNVRELQNVMQRAVVLEHSGQIGLGAVPDEIAGASGEPAVNLDMLDGEGLSKALKRIKARYEKTLIQQALDRAEGNKTRAAELLQISRVNLHQKVNQYELE